jgi:speckle-type POZ protein
MESSQNTITINKTNSEIFKKMLLWVYCGEIKFPENIKDVFELLLLADEYMLNDLKLKCEEDMISMLDENNIL